MSVIENPVKAATKVTERDLLLRAADMLEEFEWCQGMLARNIHGGAILVPNGQTLTEMEPEAVCRNGALWLAIEEMLPAVKLSNGLYGDAFVKKLFDSGEIVFNDTPGRTKAGVVARLRKQAAAYQAKEELYDRTE